MGILRTDVISHSQLSNGNASVLFDGTTDSLTIPSHSALAFGTGDWTVEGGFISLILLVMVTVNKL